MNETEAIIIESLSQLHELLRISCIDVTWFVRCDIGPDWTEGGRDIQLFYEDKQLLGSFCDTLTSTIITAASIPSHSADAVITGEGELSLQTKKLVLNYEWSEAIPYDYPRDSGHGTVELSIS